MQTHDDRDFGRQFMEKLEGRAKKMVEQQMSTITSGFPGETAIDAWIGAGGIHVTKMPDDEQGILRISVGGGIPTLDGDYCTFRGNRAACLDLLSRALTALSERSGSCES